MAHDQLFKELLRAFFREFLELFFPKVAARLDFHRVTFLDKEVFTDLPEGSLRRADVVAQIPALDGTPEIILLHIEVESERRPKEFPYRMFEYYMMLRLRYKLPVFPIVVYLAPGAGGLTHETYSESLFDMSVLDFRYSVVGLPDLSADDYQEQDNPLAALSALMKPSKGGKATQKFASLRRVATSSLNEARKFLLVNVIETYLKLSKSEQDQFHHLLTQEGNQEVRTMISVYEVKGVRRSLLSLIRYKFGELPKAVEARIEAIEDEDELERLLKKLVDANSLKDMGLTENEA